MHILLWLNKSRIRKDGQCSLCLRITLNGEREQFSLGIYIPFKSWDKDKQFIIGDSVEIIQKNEQLRLIKFRVNEVYNRLLRDNLSVTAFDVRQVYAGNNVTTPKLLEAYIAHNTALEELIGITHRKSTLIAFKCNFKILKEFINVNYKQRDVVLNKLTKKFIVDYSVFLLKNKQQANATVHKNLQRLNKIINYAVQNDWLDRNPFVGFHFKLEKKEIQYLTTIELEIIENKMLPIERLARVRDYFIFQCYTGLSYIDIKHLRKEDIREGVDGELWIFGKRIKTGTAFRVPLLPKAIELIKFYENSTDFVFNIPPNQTMNGYLKEIQVVCGISKDLQTHLARKTFCTTVMLLNGVPMETITKMAGHSSIKVTESAYAKVLDEKISRDFNEVKRRLK